MKCINASPSITSIKCEMSEVQPTKLTQSQTLRQRPNVSTQTWVMCLAWNSNIDVEKEFYEQEINRKCFFTFGHFILNTKEHQNVIQINQWDIWLSVLGLLLEMLLLTSYKRSFMIDFHLLNRFLVCNRIIHKFYKKIYLLTK